MISGYLISLILFENLERGTFSFAEFYARRIMRIFPALILVLVVSFVFGWFALRSDEYKQLGKHIVAGAGFVSNLVLWTEAGYFDNSAETKPLLHLWSLGIEEQFYLIWPLLLAYAWKRKFNLLTITLLVASASFVLNLKGVKTDATATFYSPLTRFWELLGGSVLAWTTVFKKDVFGPSKMRINACLASIVYHEKPETNGRTLSDVLSIIGLLILIFCFWRMNSSLSFPGLWALLPVLAAIMIISAGANAWANRTILSNKVAVWFGLISFPLYLWHWPLLAFARIVEGEVPASNIRLSVIILTILLAWITYKFLERPIRFTPGSKTKLVMLIMLMCIVAGVGYDTYRRDGYAFRSTVINYLNNKNELVRTPAIDTECLYYVGNQTPRYPYCRFTNAKGSETIAIIGDSHAHIAYPGIAESLKEQNVNTLLLANSSCPSLLNLPIYSISAVEQQACVDKINEMIEVVLVHKDIKKVFLFTRGMIYFTGTAPITGNSDVMNGIAVTLADYKAGMQRTIDKLVSGGKQVFYVTENPELTRNPDACIVRPLRFSAKSCNVDKSSVNERQKDYLSMLRSLSKVTLIDSMKAFCSANSCIVFDESGALLYADDNHLSVAGSRFQAKYLLNDLLHSVNQE